MTYTETDRLYWASERGKEVRRRYRQSKLGKETAKRWNESPNGRISIMRTMNKYVSSFKGNTTRTRYYLNNRDETIQRATRYKQSPQGKVVENRYKTSEKGRASKKRYWLSNKVKQRIKEVSFSKCK